MGPINRKKRTMEEVIADMTMMDDPLMTTVFSGNIPATQLVIQIILGRDDLTVVRVDTQQTLNNLQGRSLRLDVLAEDDAGNQYNIEIQNDSSGASLRRARYHSSLLDASLLPAGQDVRTLPETYVIFITRWDVLKYGLPIYHINRTIQENGAKADDGTHIIFVNGSCQDDSELGKLMQDFHSSSPERMNYDILRQEVQRYKSEEKGQVKMCAALREYMEDARAEGVAEGKAAGKAEGIAEGKAAGIAEGIAAGKAEGIAEGKAVGKAEGIAEGKAAGKAEGIAEGKAVGKAEGIAEGKAAGIAEGKAAGIAEGKAAGKTEGQREIIITLLRLNAITPEQAAMASSLSLEEAVSLATSLKQ